MSDESTTPDVEQERAERAAELVAAAQALFLRGEEDAASEQAADEEPQPESEVAEAEEAEDPEEPEEADGQVVDQEDAAEGEQADDEPAATPEPASAFGLLFQAPDLTDLPRRRSRRATSGVTTPPPAPVEDPTADAEDEPQQGDDEQGQDDGGSTRSSSGRRRRGGKGRRGRPGSDAGENEDSSGDDSTDPSADGGSEQGGDTADEGSTGGSSSGSRRRSRSRRGSRSGSADQGDQSGQTSDLGADGAADSSDPDGTDAGDEDGEGSTRRRRRRRRSGESGSSERPARDQVASVRGSTRLEAKRQRRREGREAGRRRTIITEAEFLARRESVDRVMVVRGLEDRTQIAVLEDGVPVEHYVSQSAQTTTVGNVYLGRVQNVLPSMEAAFVDIGKGRNAVLYAGEVNWDAAGMVGSDAKRIENALKSGESVLVQVTKDPIGHKGARLTSQVSLPGRYLVYVPGNTMNGISRKLPDTERNRLKKILKEVLPEDAGVIVRTAAEGASEEELRADVERLKTTWERIEAKARTAKAPALLHGEPDMTVRVIRDVFTEDFSKLVVAGEQAWGEVKRYIDDVAPDLAPRVEKYTGTTDIFTTYRVSEAIAKAMDRKVWLPSGGSLVIDRTEAMTVVDVNTGKFTGSGGNLEETVTRNNLEAAEEVIRQMRLRDIGGIIVIDFIDMVLESNRDLVVRRLVECLGRDRTKHQVAEVTSLGLVQMTRKRVGSGLIDVFSETCTHCAGRGIIVHTEPLKTGGDTGGDHGHSGNGNGNGGGESSGRRGRGRGRSGSGSGSSGNGSNGNGSGGNGNGSNGRGGEPKNVLPVPNPNGPTPAQIAAAAHAAAQAAVTPPSAQGPEVAPEPSLARRRPPSWRRHRPPRRRLPSPRSPSLRPPSPRPLSPRSASSSSPSPRRPRRPPRRPPSGAAAAGPRPPPAPRPAARTHPPREFGAGAADAVG